MNEDFQMMFLLMLIAIGAAAFFQMKKSSKSKNDGLLSADAPKKTALKQDRNGTQNDFLVFVQKILTLVRKERWFLELPGTLACNDIKTTLNGIIVTNGGIVGFKTLGYGGKITKKGAVWTQLMNGKQTEILNVEQECQVQKELLSSLLKENDLGDIPVEVVAVFTTPGVWLDNMSANRYHTSESFLDYLKAEKFHLDEGFNPKELGKKLDKMKYKMN